MAQRVWSCVAGLLMTMAGACGSGSDGAPDDVLDAGMLQDAGGAAANDARAALPDAQVPADAAAALDAVAAGDVAVAIDAALHDDAGADAGAPADGGASWTALTGTLGALGAAQPTLASLVISNSGETLIYLSSAPLTCAALAQSRWLGSLPMGSQVVEIVVKGAPKLQTYTVGPAEVNYAPGGKSSAYEKSADSGSVTFTASTPNGPVAGTLTASYANPTGQLSGTFSAEFCAGGQQY